MMQHAKDLLDKYNSGHASEEERALVESWYLHHKTKPSDLTQEELLEEHEAGLRALKAGISKVKRSNRVWLRVAASITGLVILALGALYLYRPNTKTTVSNPEHPAMITPGSNKAVLTLSNGERINLTDIGNGELTRQAGIRIVKQSDGQLIYAVVASHPAPLDDPAKNVLNTLEVPRGGQYQVQLPDGTKVWLNSASMLRYPSRFSKDERRVELLGEAYFEVAKKVDGQRIPFIVVAQNQEIEVLGTHFNVHAYPEEEKTSTTLLEGSVKVKVRNTSYTGLLKPGQQAEVHSLKPVHIRQVTNDDAIAWKKGYFAFENADLHTIMDNLARWYNVDVIYKGKIAPQKFGGAFPRTALLSDLLKYLEAYGSIHFKIEGRKVIVSS